MTRQSAGSASLLWLTLLFSVPAAGVAEPGAPQPAASTAEPVQAIWKHQEITFHFQSFRIFYTCTGLESKVENIMRALGVHAEVRVRSADCPSSIARMPRVVMRVVSPVEATPEALAERDKNKSVRELVERVRGKSDHRFDSLEQFPAEWRQLSLSRGRLNLQEGDCELVEQIRKKVLPKLAVRVVKDDVLCNPHQATLGQPRLEVEALMEMPKPDDKPGASPPGA
ncbi:hypothetical protein JM946_27340 [Steroidobacter sp. S1-65]|uniref:Uncharacterized protein n=1 Tax=Steroidobacter gossypii TaxID=2805490 RepID=A0ABS1X5I1_9GAMM|nr:hypothetical protein [Steroidobacter gossypii]MBM0108463.1 hypothetical protein [Steroidobacter gossypii]